MKLEVLDSRYGDSIKTTSDLIILILSKDFPLKIGELCQRMKNQFRVKISFQAVRKSLNRLVEKRILEVEDKRYSINKNYALELKRLSDQVIKSYFPGERQNRRTSWNIPEQNTATYIFENLLKADQFCNELLLDWVYGRKDKDDRTFCFQTPHYWYIFGQLGLESNIIEELRKNGIKAYYLCEGNTLLDKWASKFYLVHNIIYRTNPKPGNLKTTTGVFGDLIVQYEYPEDLFQKMEEFYNKTKNLETMQITKIAKILKFKTSITFIVIKNKVLAEKIKEEMISKFKKN